MKYYQFVNIADTTIQASDTYTFSGLKLYEGTWTETKYTVNVSDADQKFIIANDNVDISTLLVTVQTSSSDSTTTTQTKANNLVDVTSTSTVYFTQETTDGNWEIYFGDGVLGKALVDGNIISLKYVITNKDAANGATTFTSSSAIGTFTDITIATTSAASGGADAETLDSIKYNAPFSYTAQNRAVTAADYRTIVPTIYPNVQSISVWGGEYNDPAVYGKVYISIRPKTGDILTEATKNTIVTSLEDYNASFADLITKDGVVIEGKSSELDKVFNEQANEAPYLHEASIFSPSMSSTSDFRMELFNSMKFVSREPQS